MIMEQAAVYEMGTYWPVCPAQISETIAHVSILTNNEHGGKSDVPNRQLLGETYIIFFSYLDSKSPSPVVHL